MITPFLITMLGLTAAVPLPATQPVQATQQELSCSNLDIWKEWKSLGVPSVANSAESPKDFKDFEVQDNQVKVVLRGEHALIWVKWPSTRMK